MTQSQRNNVFISYSHADKQWLERLKVHLKPLERQGVIDLWSDEKIHAGSNWKEEIKKALKEAVVAVLLISADFLASDFIDKDELPPLLAAAKKEDTVILPVIIGHSSFTENESLSLYQAVNSPDKPLEGMTKVEQDAVFYNLYKLILNVLKKREGKNNQKADIESDKRIRAEEQERDLAVPKIKLRSRPIENLTEDVVEIMVKDKGYFDSDLNELGTGFPHKYEIQKEGRVLYDHTSGLMWQQSGSTKGMLYEKVKDYVEALNNQNFAGYKDWRLPTLEEAMSLMEQTKMNGKLYIGPKFDKQQWIWTSDLSSALSAWVVCFDLGRCLSYYVGFDDGCVRGVR